MLKGCDQRSERSASSISGVTTRRENAVLKIVWRDIGRSEVLERGANIFINIELIDILFTSKEKGEISKEVG